MWKHTCPAGICGLKMDCNNPKAWPVLPVLCVSQKHSFPPSLSLPLSFSSSTPQLLFYSPFSLPQSDSTYGALPLKISKRRSDRVFALRELSGRKYPLITPRHCICHSSRASWGLTKRKNGGMAEAGASMTSVRREEGRARQLDSCVFRSVFFRIPEFINVSESFDSPSLSSLSATTNQSLVRGTKTRRRESAYPPHPTCLYFLSLLLSRSLSFISFAFSSLDISLCCETLIHRSYAPVPPRDPFFAL